MEQKQNRDILDIVANELKSMKVRELKQVERFLKRMEQLQ